MIFFYIISENGRIYIFYGGNQMPKGNATFSPLCDQEQPCPSNIVRFIEIYQ